MARKALTGASAVVLALVLALVVPGFSQPFADVPTNHWAYDAIAELAAKGLIEGYPDGTFKGNQPLTRYEMAMVVARLVARIEAIPTPPPPEVRRADLDAVRRDIESLRGSITTIQRLVNEFRAELQALGVRVTALEEELSALRARLDNTKITGQYQFQYTFYPDKAPIIEVNRIRLNIVGTVGPNVSATLRARWFTNTSSASTVDFDRAYLDWTNAFDLGLNFRLGRQVIDLGPVGLLLNETNYNDRRDGIKAEWAVGPVKLMGFAQWQTADDTTTRYLAGGRATFELIPGFTVGVNVRSDVVGWASDNNPPQCTQVPVSGTQAPSCSGFGFGADLKGDLLSGLTLTVEYANYTPTGFESRSYFQAMADFDLAALAGIEMLAPKLSVWYKNFDPYVIPGDVNPPGPRGLFATPDDYQVIALNDNLTAFGAKLSLKLLENLSAFGIFESGNYKTAMPGGETSYTVVSAGGTWTVAPKVDVTFSYNAYTPNVGSARQVYTVYLTTTW